jgi:hypothetical protein
MELTDLVPYMYTLYGFTRLAVVEALIAYEENQSPKRVIISGGITKSRYNRAGWLIKKAKKDKVITTTNPIYLRSRYYKFVNYREGPK